MENKKTFAEATQDYLAYIKADYAAYSLRGVKEGDTFSAEYHKKAVEQFQLSVTSGPKYSRVVVSDPGRRVHSFLDKDGNIWKAAGWKAPALNFIRGNIFKPETWVGRVQWTSAQ